MLLGILGVGVVDHYIEVGEIPFSLGVFSASQIENVGHSHLDKLLGLEGRLIGSHDDAGVDLK
jgi:hypothetical protein